MLKAKDLYRIKKADLKMIVCVVNGVSGEFDLAHTELGNIHLVKALVGDKDLKRGGSTSIWSWSRPKRTMSSPQGSGNQK